MRRNLSRSENLYAGEMRTQAVRTITVRGGVDPDALGAAFAAANAAVLADHPSLRSRLEQDTEGSFLSPLKPHELPCLVGRPDGPDALGQEWNTPLPLGGPLVRAVLLTGEDEDTLVLGTDHAICDGRSATALCVRLWPYYADIKAGTHSPVRPIREDWSAAIDDRLTPVTETDVAAYVQGRLDRAEGAPVGALPYLAARSRRGGPPSRAGPSRAGRSWTSPRPRVSWRSPGARGCRCTGWWARRSSRPSVPACRRSTPTTGWPVSPRWTCASGWSPS